MDTMFDHHPVSGRCTSVSMATTDQNTNTVAMDNQCSPAGSRPSCALVGIANSQTTSSLEDLDESFEDVDEDEISDDDCYLSIMQFKDAQEEDEADKLMKFADMVTKDITKFFGQKKNEDSCNIYEDKWMPGKSGRELYYADLLRIAQGGEEADDKNDKLYTGKMDKKQGLGPLKELFEIGLHNFIMDKQKKELGIGRARGRRSKNQLDKLQRLVPMNQRRLPASFWQEPPGEKSTKGQEPSSFAVEAEKEKDGGVNSMNGVMQTGVPDFSDLLELDNWTGYDPHGTGMLGTSSAANAMEIGH